MGNTPSRSDPICPVPPEAKEIPVVLTRFLKLLAVCAGTAGGIAAGLAASYLVFGGIDLAAWLFVPAVAAFGVIVACAAVRASSLRENCFALASVAASLWALRCWGRYADVHWHGPADDWPGLFLGADNMHICSCASMLLSLLAAGCAFQQFKEALRARSPIRGLVATMVALVSAEVVLFTWFAVT